MFIQTTKFFSGPMRIRDSYVDIDPSLDIAANPILIWQGLNKQSVVDAIVLIGDTAFTDGTNALKYSAEIYSQDIQVPLTTGLRLINNLGITTVTAGAVNAYTYPDLGTQSMIPLRGLVKKSPESPSSMADARLGLESYDLAIRANAKAAQSGRLYIRVLSYQLDGPEFREGADGTCCVVGFTPSSN